MPRLILIRHGATAWSGLRYCGRTDLALSPTGKQQVHALADHLQKTLESGCPIVASPLRRAQETAAILGSELNQTIRLDPALREIDFGEVEGALFTDLQTRWPAIAASLEGGRLAIDWPGGERWDQLVVRAQDAWTRLAASETDLMVVTHGALVRVILHLALGDHVQLRLLQPAQCCVLQGPPWGIVELWPP